MGNDWLNMVKWTDEGLVPAIAQDAQDGTILMVAWMNREALDMTAREGRAVYWSRSRRNRITSYNVCYTKLLRSRPEV